jgi:radical SAM superfamily enzyme YgiQ (UPF0313 family)
VAGALNSTLDNDQVFHVKHLSPHILLINPWVTDFAAYNFWIKPLGLLRIGSLLRANGFRISLIDCLDFETRKKDYGDGKFHRKIIEKPGPLKSIPRNYSQYGMPDEVFRDKLFSVKRPDAICITSSMTYWYPGVFKVIRMIREGFSGVPIILGGIYATLCQEHAVEFSGADFVFKGRGGGDAVKLISALTQSAAPSPVFQDGVRKPGSGSTLSNPRPSGRRVEGLTHSELSFDPGNVSNSYRLGGGLSAIQNGLASPLYPAFDLYPKLDYLCIETSRGCPYHCTYCANSILNDGFFKRDAHDVVEEITYWATGHRVGNFAFYDDALLVESHNRIVPILEELMRRGLRCNFHAPNGLHVREIDEDIARLLYQSQFKTIRLGFETSDEAGQAETGGKVDNIEFLRAVAHLRRAGYPGQQVGVYILVGLPGQESKEVEESVAFVRNAGAKPILVEYSPIPHTPLFEKAKKFSRFDLETEPLFQNNSILPCQWEGLTWTDYQKLKEELRG